MSLNTRHFRQSLAVGAMLLSSSQVFVGLRALVQPEFGLRLISFPSSPAETPERRLAHGLVRRFAVRDVAIGLNALSMVYMSRWHALGITLLCGSLMTIVDGSVSADVIGGGEWAHWCFTPINIGVGLGLLRYT